jgi:hypothetical protein
MQPELAKVIKGGKIKQPEEGVDTRWLFVHRQAWWLFQNHGFPEHVALALKRAVAPASTADLSKKEGWVLNELVNPVAQAAAAVASDLSADFAQATKWTQGRGSMRAGEVHAYLVRMVQRLEDAQGMVDAALGRVTSSLRAQSQELVKDWQMSKAAQTVYDSYRRDVRDEGDEADAESAEQLMKEGAEEAEGAPAEEKEAKAERKADGKEAKFERKADGKEAKGERKAAEATLFAKARTVFELAGRAPHFFSESALLPLLSRFAQGASKPQLSYAVGLQIAQLFLSASKRKLVKKIEPWFSPELLLAAAADPNHGQRVAAFLVATGRDAAMEAAAAAVNTSTALLKTSIDQNALYKGPLTAFYRAEPWALLCTLAAAGQQDALWSLEQLPPLLRLWKHWFSAMPIANAFVESTIKHVKNLDGQQRAHEATTSMLMRLEFNRSQAILPVQQPRVHTVLPLQAAQDEDGDEKMGIDAASAAAIAAAESDSETDEQGDDSKQRLTRLSQATGSHPLFRPLDDAGRTALNRGLGYNKKRTKAERDEAATKQERKIDVEADRQAAESLLAEIAANPAKGTKRKRSDLDENDDAFSGGSGSGSSGGGKSGKGGKRSSKGGKRSSKGDRRTAKRAKREPLPPMARAARSVKLAPKLVAAAEYKQSSSSEGGEDSDADEHDEALTGRSKQARELAGSWNKRDGRGAVSNDSGDSSSDEGDDDDDKENR